MPKMTRGVVGGVFEMEGVCLKLRRGCISNGWGAFTAMEGLCFEWRGSFEVEGVHFEWRGCISKWRMTGISNGSGIIQLE